MASVGDIFGGLTGSFTGDGLITTGITMIIGTVVLVLCAFGLWWFVWKKKNWNIKVEFRLPRNVRVYRDKDGKQVLEGTINKEWGKGYYNQKRGHVVIKRKGVKAVIMKPFDVKKYLAAPSNILSVVQVGVEDYRPILEDSYLNAAGEDGTSAALASVKLDTTQSKAWRTQLEREAKNTYSITGLLHEYAPWIGQALVLFTVIVGFAIVISRLPG